MRPSPRLSPEPCLVQITDAQILGNVFKLILNAALTLTQAAILRKGFLVTDIESNFDRSDPKDLAAALAIEAFSAETDLGARFSGEDIKQHGTTSKNFLTAGKP